MLSPSEPRCQGAAAIFANPLQRGSLPSDCFNCRRRTDIVPGYRHSYIQPPTWGPWSHCPKRVVPVAASAGDES